MEYLREATGLPRGKLEDMLVMGWWAGGDEAIEFGFIDALIEDAPDKAQPAHPNVPTKRNPQQYLYDYSSRDGKKRDVKPILRIPLFED